MAEVRINGRRMPVLASVSVLNTLIEKLETWGERRKLALTSIFVNGSQVNMDSSELSKIKLNSEDLVEARMETPDQMAFESLQVSQEMADLLIFDLKVATIQIWEASKSHQKALEVLIDDCYLFLTLAARPLELLGVSLENLPIQAEHCLRELDAISYSVEDATLLCVHNEYKDACTILVRRVLPAIERWLGLSARFAETLNIDRVSPAKLGPEGLVPESIQTGQ